MREIQKREDKKDSADDESRRLYINSTDNADMQKRVSEVFSRPSIKWTHNS